MLDERGGGWGGGEIHGTKWTGEHALRPHHTDAATLAAWWQPSLDPMGQRGHVTPRDPMGQRDHGEIFRVLARLGFDVTRATGQRPAWRRLVWGRGRRARAPTGETPVRAAGETTVARPAHHFAPAPARADQSELVRG